MTDHLENRRGISARRRLLPRRPIRGLQHRLGVWLSFLAVPGMVLLPAGATYADPRPLVPPLAFCNKCLTPCPSAAANCIPLPYIPVYGPGYTGAPATRRWNLTLDEAIRIAIGNSEAVRNLGLVEAASKNDIVRSVITSYDPVQAAMAADAQWGIFDPLWTTTMVWDRMDIPPGTSFSGIGNRPPQLDTADFTTSLEQLLPLGTRVRVDSVTDYLFNPAKPPGLIPNPQYFSYTQFGVTHPLLRGAGVGVTMAPIKIASAQAEQTNWQFKQEMLALVRSVETTYWSLYAQQQNLRAIEQILPSFRETVRMREQQSGVAVAAESDVFRARADLLLYEQRRLDTLSRIAEQQLVLRNLMGLSPSDDVDMWTLALPQTMKPAEPLESAVATAINSRPDVLRQRLAVFIAQQERVLADSALKPQLDVQGYWRMNGLGQNLGQTYNVQANNDYRDWQLGVFFQMPLGRRQGFYNLRAANYKISRERAMLEQVAHQASFEVADAYRRLDWVYQQRALVASRVEALKQWRTGAQAQFDNPPPGMSTAFALELYLQNLRDGLDATTTNNALLADFNSALARLEEVKGTLLDRQLIEISGDVTKQLPEGLPVPKIQQPDSMLPQPGEVPIVDPQAPSEPLNQEKSSKTLGQQPEEELQEQKKEGAALESPEDLVVENSGPAQLEPLPPADQLVALPEEASVVAEVAPAAELPKVPEALELPTSVCPTPPEALVERPQAAPQLPQVVPTPADEFVAVRRAASAPMPAPVPAPVPAAVEKFQAVEAEPELVEPLRLPEMVQPAPPTALSVTPLPMPGAVGDVVEVPTVAALPRQEHVEAEQPQVAEPLMLPESVDAPIGNGLAREPQIPLPHREIVVVSPLREPVAASRVGSAGQTPEMRAAAPSNAAMNSGPAPDFYNPASVTSATQVWPSIPAETPRYPQQRAATRLTPAKPATGATSAEFDTPMRFPTSVAPGVRSASPPRLNGDQLGPQMQFPAAVVPTGARSR